MSAIGRVLLFCTALLVTMALASPQAQAQSTPALLPLHLSNASAGSRLPALLSAAESTEMKPQASGMEKYVGPGSCSAVACHGGIAPRNVTKVLQNEYSTWVTQDRHARAYTVLTGSLSRQMTTILKMGHAENEQRCLVCHALSVDMAHKGREFDVAEGVSCENCHGPASAWLGPHIQPTAKHADMVRLGLVDNNDLSTRTERCLTCHLGAPGLDVDHEMIAAGHPDLPFELDSFTAVEPPHWVEKDKDPLFGMKAWAVGQAAQMRASMQRVARRAKAGPWPEYSEMDCITCHHALTGPESWRQKEGYGDHFPGDAPYNMARYIVFRHFAEEIDPAANRELQESASKVANLITTMSPDRAEVERDANRTAEIAGRLINEVRSAQYDRARNARLLLAIASDGDAIAKQGERTAEQAWMSIDSLYIAGAKDGGMNTETRSAIDRVYQQLKNPSGYNGPMFAAQMKSVASTLH